ncbi:MAG: efflux RND transporter permease subunit, partial [Methylococcales bacterium]|nr:efflux RND transporter permease subunit [Methylococcales bacterium]
MQRLSPLALFISFSLLLSGCARFQDHPINPANSAVRIEARSLSDPALQKFIEGVVRHDTAWPFKSWDIDRLTLAAIYYHPDLALARAQAETADAATTTAAQRPNPTIMVTPTWIRNLATAAIPWIAASAINIPIETASVSGNAPLMGVAAAVGTGVHPVRIKDFARVERMPEPVFNIVTANGVNAVLLNIYSQPDGSTLDIARQLKQELELLKKALPPEMQATVFYDQSLLVGDSIQSVWEAIFLGLILSIAILYVFLKNWGATLIAAVVIPSTVLITLLALRVMGLSFNLMTLGGIAAAVGLIIDDAIVVVEAVHAKISKGTQRVDAVIQALGEIFRPLLASTLTPVVVFIPLAFLDGVAGSFFRALALTMVI